MQARDARSDYRETARPVAATLRPAAPRRAGALVVGLGLASVLFGTWWVLREPPSLQSSAPAIAAGADARARATPARPPVATPTLAQPRAVQPLDREESTASTPPADAPSGEPPQARSAVAGSVPSAQRTPSAGDTQAQPATEDPAPPGIPAPEPESGAAANSPLPVTPLPALPAFDAGAAKRALGTSALAASSCRKGDDPRGTAEVIVTFAPSGRVTSANVNAAPYGGTATGGCIAAAMRAAVVPPFGGDHVTVRKLVTVR
ncbi:MAG TPA: hypothetical protein VFU02_11345 [Polyangiaceae bacterium]|nr:hypothetical protein [Polyangiaceae bacterium]